MIIFSDILPDGVITLSDLLNLLEKLSNAHVVSGYEGSVRQIIEDKVRAYVDGKRTDRLGILIATKRHAYTGVGVECRRS